MKKSKKQKTLEVESVDSATSRFDEHQVSEFLHKYGSTILYTLIGLAVAITIFYQFTRSSETSSIKDYLQADRTYHQFLNASAKDADTALEPLQKLMARHPDLKQKYEG